jgi:hypothetical protein
MKSTSKVSRPWMSSFLNRVLGLVMVLDLVVFAVLWVLGIAYLFAVVLTYEGFFVTFLGVLQTLASYVYKEDRGETEERAIYRSGFSPVWFDFRRFTKLTPEERKRYRQEGILMVIVGLGLLVGVVVLRFSVV